MMWGTATLHTVNTVHTVKSKFVIEHYIDSSVNLEGCSLFLVYLWCGRWSDTKPPGHLGRHREPWPPRGHLWKHPTGGTSAHSSTDHWTHAPANYSIFWAKIFVGWICRLCWQLIVMETPLHSVIRTLPISVLMVVGGPSRHTQSTTAVRQQHQGCTSMMVLKLESSLKKILSICSYVHIFLFILRQHKT